MKSSSRSKSKMLEREEKKGKETIEQQASHRQDYFVHRCVHFVEETLVLESRFRKYSDGLGDVLNGRMIFTARVGSSRKNDVNFPNNIKMWPERLQSYVRSHKFYSGDAISVIRFLFSFTVACNTN